MLSLLSSQILNFIIVLFAASPYALSFATASKNPPSVWRGGSQVFLKSFLKRAPNLDEKDGKES